MSQTQKKPGTAAAKPNERWMLTASLSFIPFALAAFVPQSFRIPLAVVGAALLGWGIVQMLRQPPTDLRGE